MGNNLIDRKQLWIWLKVHPVAGGSTGAGRQQISFTGWPGRRDPRKVRFDVQALPPDGRGPFRSLQTPAGSPKLCNPDVIPGTDTHVQEFTERQEEWVARVEKQICDWAAATRVRNVPGTEFIFDYQWKVKISVHSVCITRKSFYFCSDRSDIRHARKGNGIETTADAAVCRDREADDQGWKGYRQRGKPEGGKILFFCPTFSLFLHLYFMIADNHNTILADLHISRVLGS